jgi:hypothetical protein
MLAPATVPIFFIMVVPFVGASTIAGVHESRT